MFSLVRLKREADSAVVLHVALDPAYGDGELYSLLCSGERLPWNQQFTSGMFAGDVYCRTCFKESLAGAERLGAILTLLRSVVLQ